MNQIEETRFVKKWGNSAGILLPKEWIGEKVSVIKQPRKSVEEQIIDLVSPYLDKIIGVYLFGSQARGEQKEGSDVDLLIITSEKLEIKKKDWQVTTLPLDSISQTIKLSPVIMYSALAEARPIINKNLLQELRNKYHPKISDFKDFIKETKIMVKLNESYLELDKEEGKSFISRRGNIYSIVLRLRSLYIIKCLLKKELYSNKHFELWLREQLHDLSSTELRAVIKVYKSVKNDKETTEKIRISIVDKVLMLLKEEVKKYETKEKA